MLGRWSSWGSLPKIFDESESRFESERAEVRRLLPDGEAWAQARRTTLNAHYTSAEVVQAMWNAARALGFQSGRVLEPGCGSGNFLGFAPEGSELVGVELDATTAAIAKHLHGARAEIHEIAFEDYHEPEGSFDLVIGNVPFAAVAPFDPRHNRGQHTLHNYVLLKSLHLLRPGGVLLALTSRYTLDAKSPSARREMAGLADLLGAIRLPKGAFATSSGTDVVVDLVVLRRRVAGAEPSGPAWVAAVEVDVALPDDVHVDEPPMLNEFLAEHREMILGELTVDRGMYREHELTVLPTGELEPQVRAALDRLTADAQARDLAFVPAVRPGPSASAPPAVLIASNDDRYDLRFAQEGSYVVGRPGEIGQYVNGVVKPYRPKVSRDINELRRLVRLRDAARDVLEVQRTDGTADEIAATQHALTEQYETYRRYYGPLNRFRLVRTGHRDPETGEVVMRRDYPRMGGFRRDPDWPLVAALEVFDDETQQARPAPIFTQRVVAPPAERHRANSPADAVAVCLDETGTVTAARISELLGITEHQAKERLAGLVFEDPASGELVPAARYLSGDIREKIDVASDAAERDERWLANLSALETGPSSSA